MSKDNGSTGGFKFGNFEPKGGESKGGFVFGTASTATTASTTTTMGSSTTSGFIFGNQNSTDAKPSTGGFSFGASSKDSEKTSVESGFKFGSVAKASEQTDSSTGASGFVFGKTSERSDNSKPTGFTFGKSGSKDSTSGTGFGGVTAEVPPKADSTSLSSGVGHSAQCLATAPTPKAESKGPTVNFNFGTGQSTTDEVKTLNNNTEGKPSQQASKPVTGGFSFGATPVQNTSGKMGRQ